MIDLTILKDNPELAQALKLEVTASDLMAFGESIHQKAVEEAKKNAPPEAETYLTPQELADKLKVSLVTIWSYDKRGITTPLYIGKGKRYRLSDIEKSFLQQ
jgi:hypothetical protein